MPLRFGLQTGQQECTYDDLVRVWQLAEDRGFDAVFTSDHFYGIPPKQGEDVSYETVSTLTALALNTKRVRIGCMVFCSAYRSPGLIAKIASTIDHWSGGRFELGLGAGSVEIEYRAYGYSFPPPKVRLDMLEEAAKIVPAMLHEDEVTFSGEHFKIEGARCTPGAFQPKVKLWIGGKGVRRIIPIAARHADVWNGNNMTPEEYTERIAVLDEWCDRLGRDPNSIERSINVGFHVGADRAGVEHHRDLMQATGRRPTEVLFGTPGEVVDQVGAYVTAGVQQINLNVYGLRPPFDWEALQGFAEDVMPAFR